MRTPDTTPSARSDAAVRMSALGGVLGPAVFIGAWTAGALVTRAPYSSIDDAISRLAAVGADTRGLMTVGFVGFGVGIPIYASALRRSIGGAAWVTATATGLAMLGVAATPLDRSGSVDRWHAVFAGLGYITLAATPLLASRRLRAPGRGKGQHTLGRLGLVAGAVSAVSLALSLTSLPTGLFQRLGLTVSDLWIAASAVAISLDR